MSKYNLMAVMAVMDIINCDNPTFGPAPVKQKAKLKRPCLNCGNDNSHNNSFCSAKCCKIYKAI